jgi:hypothetical protein
MQADTDYRNRQNLLTQWAAGTATNINQLKTNLAGIGQYNVPSVQAKPIMGQPQFDAQGNLTTRYGGGYSSDDNLNKNLFGL